MFCVCSFVLLLIDRHLTLYAMIPLHKYLPYREQIFSSRFGGPALSPWLYGQVIPANHPDLEHPQVFYTNKTKESQIKQEFRSQFKLTSINNTKTLAEHWAEQDNGSDDAKKLFGHMLDTYPNMEKGCNYIDMFFHATPMMLWTIHHLDVDYISVIPKGCGPIYNKTEMSGQEYFDDFLTPEVRKMFNANNLCPCLLPGCLVPQSLFRATTPHLGSSEDARSPYIFVGDTATGATYFSLFKGTRMPAYYHVDRRHSLIAIPRRSLGKTFIHSVGVNTPGCENLGYTFGVIRITKM